MDPGADAKTSQVGGVVKFDNDLKEDGAPGKRTEEQPKTVEDKIADGVGK